MGPWTGAVCAALLHRFHLRAYKVIKDGNEVEFEIDEEANEVKKRKIIGLMKKDQIIDIFREAEIKVGNTQKRMYENITHA